MEERRVPRRVRLALFGLLVVGIGDVSLGPEELGGRRAKQVLEVLTLAGGHPVPKDRLARTVWRDAPPSQATASLENSVSLLRRRLRRVAGRPLELVVTERGAYRLAVETADVDLSTFDELVDAAAHARDAGERRRLLDAALAIPRGAVLEDEPDADWAADTRERYRIAHVGALVDAADAALREDDLRTGIAHARHAVELDALNERAVRRLMLAHYALGSQADARRTFERCRAAVAEQLGVRPMLDTEELDAAIRRRVRPSDLLARVLGVTPGGPHPPPPGPSGTLDA